MKFLTIVLCVASVAMAGRPNDPTQTNVADPNLPPVQPRGAHARPNVAAGAARGGPMFFDLPQRQGITESPKTTKMMMMKVLISMMAMISVTLAVQQKLHNGVAFKPISDDDVKINANPVLTP